MNLPSLVHFRLRPHAVAILTTAALLSACSPSAVMSDFSTEKSRVRSALSNDIACREEASPAKSLYCSTNQLTVTLNQEPGGLGLTASYVELPGPSPRLYAELEKLAKAYGFEASDLRSCAASRQHQKQLDAHAVSCTNTSSRGRDLTLSIRPSRRV